ncbi:MAG: helix-turn-helix domain-containing protein [Myxococcaceae bacterium]
MRRIGERIRARRKQLRVSSTTAAEAAGMSRVTLYRIERGEPSVAMGAYLNAIAALGLELHVRDPSEREGPVARLPKKLRLEDYPQLRKLAWQLGARKQLTAKEALDLYERNWRHLNERALTPRERELVNLLFQSSGRERPLV